MVCAVQSDVSRLDYYLQAQVSASHTNSGCNEACFVLSLNRWRVMHGLVSRNIRILHDIK